MLRALQPTQEPGWVLSHEGYSVLTESGVESRFAFGNGFLGMRAARSISRGPTWTSWLGYIRWASWPRCYLAGLFDTPNTEPPVLALVPIADWSRVRALLDGEPLPVYEGGRLVGARTLDMRRGALFADFEHRTEAGITLTELRLRLLADRAAGMQRQRFSVDRDGVDVQVEATFGIAGFGMEPLQLEEDLGAWRTEGTKQSVAMMGAATLRLGGELLTAEHPFPLRWVWRWRSTANQVAELDRLLAVARSDAPDENPAQDVRVALTRSRAFGRRVVLSAHEAAWTARWAAGGVSIEGDDELQRAVRFAVYHLTSAADPEDERVSIGARGLTGDAYFGQVFWDTEIYLLPLYTATWPEAARSLLMYRFHTLPAARTKAPQSGYKGALYAWESADTGVETTPETVFGPDGELVEILTGKMEHHTSADVAYAVWEYWRATGDDDFFIQAGAEIVLETARFWASRAVVEADGQRHIRHVIEPHEYHEDVDDNSFTNIMARWNIARALEAVEILHERCPSHADALEEKLALPGEELADWRDAVARMATGLDPDRSLRTICGFPRTRSGRCRRLQRLFLAHRYDARPRAHPVLSGRQAGRRRRTDRDSARGIPRREGRTKFPPLRAALRAWQLAECVDARAGRGAARRSRHGAELFAPNRSLDLDPDPNSAGGIRIAGLGGLWQAIVLGFGGIDLTGETLRIEPQLPPQWRTLSFRTCWRGRTLEVRASAGSVEVTLDSGEAIDVEVDGVIQHLVPSEKACVSL
ncbi:MAG: glycoside hydrolase family 65 protein [Acetobacteraceae bacterium]|nr:glycoside hydrolase family 65 protein [Acetobacteraceae bacterium]